MESMVEDIVRSLGFLCLGTRMRRIGERLQAETQKIVDYHGMNGIAGQFPYLAALDRQGPLTVGELAEAIGVTQPGATRTIGQLIEAGLIASETAADDQRRRINRLTPVGQELVDDASRSLWPAIEAAVADLCGGLDGPLLGQLAAMEDGLADRSLLRRNIALAPDRHSDDRGA